MEQAFRSHMNSSFDEYLARTKMDRNAVWGTDVEILSAASLLQTDIYIYTKVRNAHKWHKFSRTMLGGKLPSNDCSIYIQHTNGNHYDVMLDVISGTDSSGCNDNVRAKICVNDRSSNSNQTTNGGTRHHKRKCAASGKEDPHHVYKNAKFVQMCETNANSNETANRPTRLRKRKCAASAKKEPHHVDKNAKFVQMCETNANSNQTTNRPTRYHKHKCAASGKEEPHLVDEKVCAHVWNECWHTGQIWVSG